MRNMDFNIAAVVIMLFLGVFFFAKYKLKTYSSKYFFLLIVFIMCTSAMNVLSDSLLMKMDRISISTIYLIYSVYLFFAVGCPYIMIEYTRALITNSRKIGLLDFVNQMVVLFHTIFCILNTKFGYYITISENGELIRGKYYILVFLISGYYLIFSAVRMLIHFSKTNMTQVFSVLGFVSISVIGALLQYFIFGNTIVIYFVYSMASLILLFSFETPDFVKLIQTTEELKHSQEELQKVRDREEELNHTVHQLTKSAAWVIYFDEEGKMSEAQWSEEFTHMMGYEDGEYLGDVSFLWMESLHPEDKDKTIAAFMAGMQGQPYKGVEARLIDKKGNERWYECSGELKRDSEGKVKSYQGFVRDIEEEKRLKILTEEKLQAVEELEESQKNLKAALFAAEEASRAKTSFLSNMSHDIRTPMNAIVGFTQLAQAHLDDREEVTECLATIKSSSEHLLSLINDVLDMSRIESGKVRVENTPCDLRVICNDIRNMIQAKVEEKKQTYTFEMLELTNPYVMCDRLRLNQILINVIGNAIKYTPDEGKVEFKLIQEKSDDSKSARYLFSVKDNGIGMSKEFVAKVFEPFERDKALGLKSIQGTGLGMAITKNLVEMMGGSIKVESELGKGSTFFVAIPFEMIDEEKFTEYGNDKNESVSIEKMLETLKGKHFLVVDDNRVNRTICRKLLEDRGMLVDECESGQEAINILGSANPVKYDVVFMDIQMPVRDGYETTDVIRNSENEYLKNVYILAMTANAFEEDKRRAIEHGMNGHITKPFKIDELIKKLYQLLGRP